MPDITKCVNINCPLNHRCFRFTAIPNVIGQSYSLFLPKRKTEGVGHYCDYFKPIPNTDESRN